MRKDKEFLKQNKNYKLFIDSKTTWAKTNPKSSTTTALNTQANSTKTAKNTAKV